jgi:hypothetical protein
LIRDLQTVVDALRSNPETLKTGIKAGPYSVAYGKLWRGSTVIGYLPPEPPAEGENTPLQILYTSHTSPEEAAIFKSPAPPTPAAAPAMTLNSPEGQQSEEPGSEQQQQPPQPSGPAPAGAGAGEPGEVVGPGGEAEEKPASGKEGAVFKRGKGKPPPSQPRDAARLGAPRGENFYP